MYRSVSQQLARICLNGDAQQVMNIGRFVAAAKAWADQSRWTLTRFCRQTVLPSADWHRIANAAQGTRSRFSWVSILPGFNENVPRGVFEKAAHRMLALRQKRRRNLGVRALERILRSRGW